MKIAVYFCLVAVTASLTLSGCADRPADQSRASGAPTPTPGTKAGPVDEEASVRANLEQLGPEDRQLAEEQKFCPVQNNSRLGSMGVPVKVMVKDQPVFLCCGDCRTKALAHADRTLARVNEFKERKR